MKFKNRVTEMLGVELPIVQAPMGWIARSQLASAVGNAGGMGIIETSSGELDAIKVEIKKMRDLTDKPFGVNIAQAFVRDPNIVQFVIDQGIKFVTTSAGSPMKYTADLKAGGLMVFHVVPTLAAALKAVAAGVDGLIVEGGEGGGFKNPNDVASMVLLPLVRSKVDVPIIAAGGFDERYIRAQDWELNHRMRKQGGLIWFDPRLVVTYRPRNSFPKLAKQYFQYGRWRRVIARQHPQTVNYRYLAPPIAVVITLISVVGGLFINPIFIFPTLTYLTLILIGGFIVGKKLIDRLLMPFVLITMHFSWGVGFLTSPKKLFKN